MKLLFKFDDSSFYKSTCVFLNDENHSWRDEYVRIYLDTLNFDSSITLADLSIDKDYVSTDVMDAVIDKDRYIWDSPCIYLKIDLQIMILVRKSIIL